MSHSQLDQRGILNPYITDGKVDYQMLIENNWLEEKLKKLRQFNPDTLHRGEQLAFWLNAYNILTLEGVIFELKQDANWEGMPSIGAKVRFFYWRRFKIGGYRLSLFTIENEIIRKRFKDPRIHFVLNCASKSCPYLPKRLFSGEDLNETLEDLTGSFINEQGGVEVTENVVKVSKIFDMYTSDFDEDGGIRDFVKTYWEGDEITDDKDIEFMTYDWSLNSVDQEEVVDQ